MLIIFDLDDTLIDSSGSIIPIKLKAALQAMVKAGLKVPSLEHAFKTMLDINATAPNGKETMRLFLDSIRADARFLEIGAKEYYSATETDFAVSPLPYALELLKELQGEHDLVLVSSGEEQQQKLKLKKANLDPALFQKIIICEGYNKKIHYRKLLQEFNCKPSEVLVCGDKFETDLLPAKELKMWTVQMLWGRHSGMPGREAGPDYSIRHLSELKRIVQEQAA